MIPSTTVLWPVHNPVPFKQACIYTTEDTIVCDEICIHTNKLQHGFFLDILVANCSAECRVSSGSEIRTRDLRFQGEDDTTTRKGLTRKCGRITSVTTLLLDPDLAVVDYVNFHTSSGNFAGMRFNCNYVCN